MVVKFSDQDIEDAFAVGEEGVYSAEVAEVEEKATKTNGDEMWSLKFKDAENGEHLCYDNLVFSKGGKGMAWKKIKMLGVKKNKEGFYEIAGPQDLVGRRVELSLVKETYQGKEKLAPNAKSDGFGYAIPDTPF